MDGQTIRNESSTSREIIDLPKAAAGLVPLVLALASCNAQRPPESTPLPDQQLPVSFYKFLYDPKNPDQRPNPEVSAATAGFTAAAQKGELVYAKLGTDGITNSVGNIKNVVAGNFGVPEASVPQQIEDQLAAPNLSSIIEIKFGDKPVFIKIVKIPTVDGLEKSILFGNFGDGKWRQVIHAQGEKGFDISSSNDGVVIGGSGKVALTLAFDSTNPPEFNSLFTAGDPGSARFKQALYPLSNKGSSPRLVLRDGNGSVSGILPEGLFDIVQGNQPVPTKDLGNTINISFKKQSLDVTPTPEGEKPTESVAPTQAAEATPSEAPTPEVPMIEVKDEQGNTISVPDILKIIADPAEASKLENAEMIKVFNDSTDAFVNAFVEKKGGETDEAFQAKKQAFLQETTAGLKPELKIGVDGKQFAVLVNLEGYPLLMTDNELHWKSAFKDFTRTVNIPTGVYLEPGKNDNLVDKVAKQNFDDIVLPIFWHVIFAQNEQHGNFGLSDSRARLAGSEMGQFGGTLLWQNKDFLPEWFKNGNVTEEQVRSMIKSIIQKYPNIKAWIPVNEPYSTDFFAKKLGYPNYVIMAFDEARKNTDAPLILNDFDIEKTSSSKYNQTKALVDTLKAQNLIDGIGIQMHINPNSPPTKEALIKNFKSWGIDVYLTELDIPTDNEELKAKIFSDIFSAAIESGVVKQVNIWGLGGAAWRQNGNLFDQNAQPTKALFEIEKTIIEHLSPSSSQ